MRKLLIALAAGLLLSLGASHPAGATQPTSGTLVNIVDPATFSPTPSTVGGSGIISGQYTVGGHFSGDITGMYTEAGKTMFRPDMSMSVQASGTCTPCAVGDRTGIVSYHVAGTGTWMQVPPPFNILPASLTAHIEGSGATTSWQILY